MKYTQFLLTVITACFVAHTWVDIQPAPITAADTLPAHRAALERVGTDFALFGLPVRGPVGTDSFCESLERAIIDAGFDTNDATTFTLDGEPVADWQGGKLNVP